MHPKTIEWNPAGDNALTPGTVHLIDQTRLPVELIELDLKEVEQVWEAIRVLRVRGAPAIGIAAAMGLVLAVQPHRNGSAKDVVTALEQAADYLATSRPTAVNLFWALDRMRGVCRTNSTLSASELVERLAAEAVAIRDEDAAMCRAIGEHGVALLKSGQTVLTHCNAGGLATAEYGTALAPVYCAAERGMDVRVISDDTRPLLQGSRLTAWELGRAGVDVTVICDNMAAQVMKERRVDLVMVGSDRIAANGDAANKIGTYGVAVLAHAHDIPFYVLAPTSTIDISLASGDEIPIEERGSDEITCGFGKSTAPEGVKVYAPAFDVTPARLITAIVTEQGVALPPFGPTLKTWVERAQKPGRPT
jgi:methylthioribose-1-phosphate isomerase